MSNLRAGGHLWPALHFSSAQMTFDTAGHCLTDVSVFHEFKLKTFTNTAFKLKTSPSLAKTFQE